MVATIAGVSVAVIVKVGVIEAVPAVVGWPVTVANTGVPVEVSSAVAVIVFVGLAVKVRVKGGVSVNVEVGTQVSKVNVAVGVHEAVGDMELVETAVFVVTGPGPAGFFFPHP